MRKSRKEEIEEITENIIEKNMVDLMSDRFGRFSKYVIQQRAIPDSRDGLKPVQRRILYSMWNLKLKNKEPFKKSARIVGDVIGRYHPHGDSSIYEALVRMSQEWKSNFPLIEMHGNKGSIDDDPAAAMRYTESRLEKIAELMLKDLDRKVVTLAPNFDDSEYEPTVLPSLFPNLLVNGSKGIASGFATEIPPHNLGEVIDATIAMIKKPNISIDSLMEYVQGPDFPTGGVVNGVSGIVDAMKTGQGKIYISSKYKFIYDEKNSEKIIGIEIYEIPFGVVKSKLVASIDAIAIDKVISGIKDVRDQSDRNGLSIYLELEDFANAEAIIAYLMNKTDLRITYNYNMVAIDKNAPTVLNLQTALLSYLSHLREVNTNGIKYDLQKYKLRLEIVEGFIRVAEISDEVIKVIKNSDNSKKGVILALIQIFKFTEIQATAIAELRLYKLSRMDQVEFQNEKLELEKNIAFCSLLLSDSYEFDKYLIKQLNTIKSEYSVPRKTLISEQKANTDIDQKLLTKNEDFYFFISKEGYIKKISAKVYSSNELTSYKVKEGDSLLYYDKINSLSKLIMFTNVGNYFVIDAHTLKDSQWKDLGNHISSIASLEANEKIIRVMEITSFNSYIEIILISKYGFAKKVKLEEFNSKLSNKTRSCMSFKNSNDELVDARISNGEKDILIILTNGSYHLINENVFTTSLALKAQGIKLLPKLLIKDNVFVSAFATVNKSNSIILLCQDGLAKIWNVKDIEEVGRFNRGSKLYNVLKNQDCTPLSLEVITKTLEFIYTNKDNALVKFDYLSLLKDRSKEDKLIKLEYDYLNAGHLIQAIKINELIDPDDEEKQKIRTNYLKNQNNNDLSLTIETALIKRNYDVDHSKKIELEEIQEDEDFEQLALFDLDDDKGDDTNKKEDKITEKLSLDEKLARIEKIDVDGLMKKVEQFKKK